MPHAVVDPLPSEQCIRTCAIPEDCAWKTNAKEESAEFKKTQKAEGGFQNLQHNAVHNRFNATFITSILSPIFIL